MQKKHGSIAYVYEDEEGTSPVGVPCSIEFDIEYVWTAGEPMVRYLPDGSGYPGSPHEVEFESPTIMRIRTDKGLIRLNQPELQAAVLKWLQRFVMKKNCMNWRMKTPSTWTNCSVR